MKKLFCLLLFVSHITSIFASDLDLGTGTLYEKSLLGSRGNDLLGNYLLYVPESSKQLASKKVVVLLHGCLQPAKDMFTGSQIQKYADREGFLVMLPEQSENSNPYLCWNWFLPVNQVKAFPTMPNEPQRIINMIKAVRLRHNVSGRNGVFIAGMSAGAGLANIVASCYPGEIGAIASHHGIAFGAAAMSWFDMEAFKELGQVGSDIPPQASAYAGYACTATYANPLSYIGKSVPSIILHGSNGYMTFKHAEDIEKQFHYYNDYLDNGFPDGSLQYIQTSTFVETEGKYPYEMTSTKDQDGNLISERYKIFGLGHSWSGGAEDMEYFDTDGPESTQLILKFFKQFGL